MNEFQTSLNPSYSIFQNSQLTKTKMYNNLHRYTGEWEFNMLDCVPLKLCQTINRRVFGLQIFIIVQFDSNPVQQRADDAWVCHAVQLRPKFG